MTLEELVIAVHVTADDAERTLDALEESFKKLGQAGESSLARVQQSIGDLVSWIDYMRRVSKISAQEEIAMLEQVRASCEMTAKELMAIDMRIYSARQALREGEQAQITALGDALVDALRARYEEQRALEQGRIAQSIGAWRDWSEETCAAIQRQIDALDAQAEAQAREKQRAESLRGIQALRQSLLYETDDYNRSQLLRELERAEAALAELERGWAREDQRTVLESEMQTAAQRAQEEIRALEAENARIDSVYDEMLKGQSLAAEAQKLLMQSTQEDLLSLLSSYAPDYEATGRTLGEKIYEGFKSAFGDISAFFAQIDAQFEQMTQNAAEAAFGRSQGYQASGQATANVASAPVITQTVNFNQPVDSPADVARRMQQVSEELAGMI